MTKPKGLAHTGSLLVARINVESMTPPGVTRFKKFRRRTWVTKTIPFLGVCGLLKIVFGRPRFGCVCSGKPKGVSSVMSTCPTDYCSGVFLLRLPLFLWFKGRHRETNRSRKKDKPVLWFEGDTNAHFSGSPSKKTNPYKEANGHFEPLSREHAS